MKTHVSRPAATAMALLLVAMLISSFAHAQVSGGGDAPKAASGLGEAMPYAVDLASDPSWQVYEFERDGIRYLQINDSANVTRAAVGQVGGTAWVLPIGADANRVTIQGAEQAPMAARIIYKDNAVEVIHYLDSGQNRWIIRPYDAAY